MPALGSLGAGHADPDLLFRTIALSPHGTTMAAWHVDEGGMLNNYQVQALEMRRDLGQESLAPYIFRVAISNKRISKLADGKVTFRYRTSDTGKLKTCILSAEEFIRRFLQHVLPKGFVKVRYYGFFSSGLRPRLAALRQQLGSKETDIDTQTADHPADDSSSSSVLYCPSCGRIMQRRRIARPKARCPP